MASFFQSFRSSSMPKRLLRYALSRLDLLDADALDMDNLDFALGRNTVFEFRDVGIKLKKLEKLLQLPAAIQLSRAKVLLLRVTVPMDFYTSPITVEVEGVEVRLKVDAPERDNSANETPPSAPPHTDVVPNTVDLAQSFLETQPSSERNRLQEALLAETQDLGASVSVSDDDCGSEDEPNALGTGQALSLPDFMADFLQGIVDRTQIKIRCVRFQLDMEVPGADASSSASTLEPLSFQIALESIEVEGVTAVAGNTKFVQIGGAEGRDSSAPTIVPKEGKRHISLANVRAFLVSEANVFSALSRSSSVASPSTASSSPVMTRNPPSRQSTLLSRGSFREQPMASLQEIFRERLSDRQKSPELEEHPLGDSEEALGIPYELNDDSPPTPRASMFQTPSAPPEKSSISALSNQDQELEQSGEASASGFDHGRLPLRLAAARGPDGSDDSDLSAPLPASVEDLTESHLYTHEEAESMYLSAFSSAEPGDSAGASCLADSQGKGRAATVAEPTTSAAELRRMPGAWGEESESPFESHGRVHETPEEARTTFPTLPTARSIPPSSGMTSNSRHSASGLGQSEMETEGRPADPDDAPTPRGPSRVVKEIMHLENVSVYVPSHHRHIQVQTGVSTLADAAQQLPSPTAPTFSEESGTAASSMRPPSQTQQDSPMVEDDAVEVVLSPLSVFLDTSLGILIAMALDKLLKAVGHGEPSSVGKPRRRKAKTDSKRPSDFRFVAQEISLNFLSQLNGVADTPGRHLNSSAFVLDNDDILLNATLQNLAASTLSTRVETPFGKGNNQASQDAVVTKIDLERFRFGYVDGDIISFDSSRPMTTSVRDAFLTDGHDVGIKMIRSDRLSKIDVETLPLVVQLDLQRLDETVGWFGGLSSFLNLSVSENSNISRSSSPSLKTATLSPSPPPPPLPTCRKSRPVVHFEAPSADLHVHNSIEDGRSLSVKNKINVRIGGALVELAGRECSVAAETNAIKVVGRDQGIGVVCSRIRFTGPYLYSRSNKKNNDHLNHHRNQSPPLSTEVGGLRLELSPVPEDRDLEKLLELIIPSKVKFDDDGGGEIMVETLLRQRRKGSVLRITVETVNVRIGNPAQLLPTLPNLGEEIAKLSTTVAAKYLPEDDRPGILTLAKLQQVGVSVDIAGKVGLVECNLNDLEVAQITVPSLVAVAVRTISIRRNGTEDLVCSAPPLQGPSPSTPEERGPVIMMRIIGDEMEPTIKVKLRELRLEYCVPTMMDALGLDHDSATPQEFEVGLAASVASLADRARLPLLEARLSPGEIAGERSRQEKKKPTAIDVGLYDCLVGLNPLKLPSKLVLVLTDARVQAALPSSNDTTTAAVHINKASLLLTDNFAETEVAVTGASTASGARQRRHSASAASPRIAAMCARGFVDICYMSSAKIAATVRPIGSDGDKQVEVELRDDLLVLETCADSTQTLIALFNALKPPTPPSRDDKFRTKVVPVQDLLASISAEAFGKPEGDYDFDYDFAGAQELAGSLSDAEYGNSSRLSPPEGSDIYDSQLGGEELFDAMAQEMSFDDTEMQDTAEGVLLTGFDAPSHNEPLANDSGDDLTIHEDFYGRDEGAGEGQTAKLWNSVKNTYDSAPNALVKASPLMVSVKDVHVIWNLFDGYDWARTRDVIAKAVEDVETKATERQQQKNRQQSKMGGGGGAEAYEEQDEDEETIGDFLFNSIYIGVPLNRDPRELTRAINHGLNDDEDNTTETESVATTTTTATKTAYLQSMQGRHRRGRRLRLHRSKHHKITFELQGVSADLVAYPPSEATAAGLISCGGQETLSSIDVRVQTLDIFDHVPTSIWKKFATYDQDQGEREMGTSMVHLELLNVRPIPDLAASEIVMRASVLPLRLHVDQDALDFITRFFEFKDEDAKKPASAPSSTSASDIPFLQRAEVLDIPVKLDFKPKRVDYAGLRSGHTTEFMNFIVLEEARMVLRHVIVYGVSGFDRLGKTLNDIWTPDVRRNQLPGVVAGLAPVRSLVNIGSGFRDLVEIPLKEYRKDGRVVRSISKGAAAFARTTGTELVKLGAKLAVGTQYALQGAEEMLLADRAQRPLRHATEREADEGDEDYSEEDLGVLDDEDTKQISLYADQPTGVLQGIRGGYRSLTRDVNLARDAIIAVPGELMESQSAGGAARAVLRRAPTIIFRPAVGVTKAIGQTLLGATNTMDPQNRRRIGEKYKH